MATSVDDGVIVEKHAVGEETLSQEQPDPFDRIEFWAVGWERNRCDIGGHDEVFGAVPAGLVHDEHDMDIRPSAGGGVFEEAIHGLGVYFWHDQREVLARLRADCGKNIGRLKTPVAKAKGAFSP